MNDKLVAEYANENGAAQVWKAWRDTMLSQGRSVDEKFMSWPIPNRDVFLDADIAFAVIDDFLVWAESHHGLRLTPVPADAGTRGRCATLEGMAFTIEKKGE